MVELPMSIDRKNVTTFIAGMIGLLSIKYLVKDTEIYILNIFSAFNITNYFIIGLILGIIAYLLFRYEG